MPADFSLYFNGQHYPMATADFRQDQKINVFCCCFKGLFNRDRKEKEVGKERLVKSVHHSSQCFSELCFTQISSQVLFIYKSCAEYLLTLQLMLSFSSWAITKEDVFNYYYFPSIHLGAHCQQLFLKKESALIKQIAII